jgi:hypothetical protein
VVFDVSQKLVAIVLRIEKQLYFSLKVHKLLQKIHIISV